MKSSPYVGLVITFILSGNVVFGQNAPPPGKPETPSEKKQDPPRAKDKSNPDAPAPVKPMLEGDSAPRQTPPIYGHEAMVDRRLAAFVRLRELTLQQVKFDADGRKKVAVMFDDYMAGLLNPRQLPHVQPRPEDAATPQELPELRKQLEAAEKAADQEKTAAIKAKIYCATIALEPSVVDDPVFFFDYFIKELDKERQKEFEPVLFRWQMLRLPEIAPDNDFKQLRRAARDPLLGASEEQAKQLATILIDAMRSVPLGPSRIDNAVMAELAAKTKPKVLEKLDPRQREHLEKTLEMLKRWDKEDPEVARKTRVTLKDHKPSHGHTPSPEMTRPSSPTTP